MKRFLFGLIIFSIATSGYSQESDSNVTITKVKGVIKELFDGYRAGDSARVAAVFDKQARIQGISPGNGTGDKLSELKPASVFVNYIGAGLSEVHDEKIWDTKIFADNMMATVWTRYAFFLGESFNHCGTEVFLLRKVNNNWKIFYLSDTRQTTGCKLPDNIK